MNQYLYFSHFLFSKDLWLSVAFSATHIEAIIESASISGFVSGVPANQITLIHYLHPFRHSTTILLFLFPSLSLSPSAFRFSLIVFLILKHWVPFEPIFVPAPLHPNMQYLLIRPFK